MRASLPWAVLLLALSVPALAERVDSLPRPVPGTWSVDTTRRLLPVTLAKVDRLGADADGSGDGQLAVVVVSTTDGKHPRAFALELFNAWGIGHAGVNDGALLFVALDDRAAEIVLGDGVDGPEELRMSDAVMQRIVPGFKVGNPDAAVLAGAEGLRALLAKSQHGGLRRWWEFDVSVDPLWLLGSGLGGLGLVSVGLRLWLRRRPRVCERCQRPRVRLNEVDDNRHLEPGQRTEETVGSVDYDVWWCQTCRDAKVERYGAWRSSYKRCRSCGYKTARSESLTRVEATYDHGGELEVTVTCEHCNHRRQFTRHTAPLTRSTRDPWEPRDARDASDSSGGSSSSGGGSSSSGGDSSSGGFGGGSSSGGGSSGRW